MASCSSSDSVVRAIDEYRDDSSYDTSSNVSSSSGHTTEEYTSGVPGIPVETFQESIRTRTASGADTSTSSPPSSPLDEQETVYSCALEVPSKTDERRLDSLRTWFQIPDDLNPRLAVRGEWCCQPRFGIGVYEAYLLGGLRLPLNAFARELLTRLGLGVCQLNPNVWRLIVSMQVLWMEVFDGDRPITVDEFLYCYKPSEINQSRGFHQFTARGNDCRLIKSLPSSDRNWKTEFFFVSGFWAGHPVEIGRDSFAPYTGDIGNLRLEAVGRPSLSKFHRDRVHRARLHPERDFHSLVTLKRLHKWGLGPEPSVEALAHELTTRRRMATMKGNKGKEVVNEVARPEPQPQPHPASGEKRKSLSKHVDLASLPSRRGKKAKFGPSRTETVRPELPPQPPVLVVDVDSSTPLSATPSKSPAPDSSQPPQRTSTNLLENEDLAWERFQEAVKGEDVAAWYDMSLKEFEHSGVHDLFKAMSKFIAASRQATEMDRTRVLLEKRIEEVKNDCRTWAEVANKAKDEAEEFKALVGELKSDTARKDERLELLQKENDELNLLLKKAKDEAVEEFKASKEFTDLMDTNYAAGFEDFRMDAMDNFPEVDFSTIKLNLAAATSSLVHTGSDDVNIEDDASTKPAQDDPNVNAPSS
ncbi:uncharacterized protein LOC142617225 [Castanea sativa]|uniref:uncharacterized protein LOC142617225 n=1 Tax=Castanea sativa TaxID=21020 RepID=UPI003F64EBEF